MKRPKILLLYTDQQRWDTIRAGGFDWMHTPNLDRLAAQGTLFNQCYVNCPVCMPSRMSMLSGLYSSAFSQPTNGIEMPDGIRVAPNYLKPYSYHTANIGKLHFINHASFDRDHSQPYPDYGFDTAIISDEPGCYDDAYIRWVREQAPEEVDNCRINTPPAWTGKKIDHHPRHARFPYAFKGPEHLTHSAFVAEETAHYIEEQASRPWFCISGFYAPHCPFNPPARFLDIYKNADLPIPQMTHADAERYNLSLEEWHNIRAHYFALVSHLDDQLGVIFEALDRAGVAEDTAIVFTSDHGEHMGDHGRTGKSAAFDSASRVPLIMSLPKWMDGPRGQICDGIVEAVDILPTILDLCAVEVPSTLHGRSFRDALHGRSFAFRDSAYIEQGHSLKGDYYRALRTREHLYEIRNDGTESLYIVSDDPAQINDRASDPSCADRLHLLRKKLLDRTFDLLPKTPQRTGEY